MQSDPRIGLIGSLLVSGAAACWLALKWFASDALLALFGSATHAITFLAIFALIAGIAVSQLFRQYANVRAELLAGVNVIASWRVGKDDFTAFGRAAYTHDAAERKGAMLLIMFFLAIVFGGSVLIDPTVAVPMLSVGAGTALAVTAAFWIGNRTRRRQLELRSGQIIVGTNGLIVNDVLHVWSSFLARLVGVEMEAGPPQVLTITYAFLARFGPQYVSVMLPVPTHASAAAADVKRFFDHERLKGMSANRSTRQRREPNSSAQGQRR